MALNHEDVREILRIIDESDLDELTIETDGFRLSVSKSGRTHRLTQPLDGARTGAGSAGAPESTAPAEHAPGSVPDPSDDGLVDIPSPMLGTFYRAESPGGAPFVEVGAHVEADTTVCIIEVMKMMNSIPAGVSGTVAAVCSDNGQLVEYGEALFRVRPQ